MLQRFSVFTLTLLLTTPSTWQRLRLFWQTLPVRVNRSLCLPSAAFSIILTGSDHQSYKPFPIARGTSFFD